MNDNRRERIMLVGNPNSGKTSLFNALTGLSQKVANFPGVTVDKKTGICVLPDGKSVEVVDLPGIYSIYPRSSDESIVAEVLLNHHGPDHPDKVIVVADSTNLNRNLLLATQCLDLGLPTLLVLNMNDLAIRAGIRLDLIKLSSRLGVPVVLVDSRGGKGIDDLRLKMTEKFPIRTSPLYEGWKESSAAIMEVRSSLNVDNDYEAYQMLQQPRSLGFLKLQERNRLDEIRKTHGTFPGKFQGAETIQRYEFIQRLLREVTLAKGEEFSWRKMSAKIDAVLTHKIWGYLVFLLVMFVIFQAIFTWASVPMDFIDLGFASLSHWLKGVLPSGMLSELITNGIIPGIGGIVIFIPQIAILFAFIAILEESGYMSRVVFIMDKLMRGFGLSGKSVVPLISGMACAIPAIMAARTIDNWKERITTIFVTPLMSCSARLPVFTIIIALVIPSKEVFGFLNVQGLALMALYLLGFFAAISSAWVMKFILRVKDRSFLLMELPPYRWPKWSNVGYTLYDKTKSFVLEAGKIILAISIVLWVLATYGPSREMAMAKEQAIQQSQNEGLNAEQTNNRIAAYKLEHSFAGYIGKSIEPIIRPLGYDWKIGIALITSFAAREVFVGTMATIYSVGSTNDKLTIKERMRDETDPLTGKPRFDLATGLSLLIFYTFAMQCMSTLAIVYRETGGWKWPVLQLTYMTFLAYISAWVCYQVFS